MDLIRELKDVRFDLNLRGYDCDSVDAFLAKVRGEVADVLATKESADRRVQALEEQLASGESDTEGTLRRTLVLAQRLADETVADARKTASELVDSATSEANAARQSAETEAEQARKTASDEADALREAARSELEQAHLSATASAEESAAEAARIRSVANDEAERLLGETERAGSARISEIEEAAQAEAAAMREPIRAEVTELERMREDLLTDIEVLERHLVEQRSRVRTAIDALRTGMSGSIDDLERLAQDDETFSPAPRPALSGASAASVDMAPDIEITESVRNAVGEGPRVESIAASDAVRTRIDEPSSSATDTDDTDESTGRPAHATNESLDDFEDSTPPAHASADGPPTERMPIITNLDSGPEIVDAEPTAEPETVLDLNGASGGALFVTEVGEPATVAAEPPNSPATAFADVDIDDANVVDDNVVDDNVVDDSVVDGRVSATEETAVDAGFVSAFTEAIDGLPVSTDGAS